MLGILDVIILRVLSILSDNEKVIKNAEIAEIPLITLSERRYKTGPQLRTHFLNTSGREIYSLYYLISTLIGYW